MRRAKLRCSTLELTVEKQFARGRTQGKIVEKKESNIDVAKKL